MSASWQWPPLVAAFLLALGPAAAAEDSPATAPASPTAPAPPSEGGSPLEERVKDLEATVQRLTEIIKQLTAKPAAAEVEKIVEERLKKQKPLVGWQNGFFLESADGQHRLRIRGALQADQRAFVGSGRTGLDSFFFRRVRPTLEGTLYRNLEFRLTSELAGSVFSLQDAYLDLRHNPQASLRVGKFKEPLSLERLQSYTYDGPFVERSIGNNLSPNRDVGIQLHGDVAKGILSYALAALNGVNDGGSVEGDTNNDKDFVGRVFAQPFRNQAKSPLRGLGVGVAGSVGERGDTLGGVNFRTAGRSSFFRFAKDVSTAGQQTRLAPQAYFYRGPLGLMGEYLVSNHEANLKGVSRDLTHRGWFAQASWVLTGEDASYRSVVPRREFDPKKGNWGAFELALRVSGLELDGDAFRSGLVDRKTSARRVIAYTLGLNWYLNRALKFQVNYERTQFDRTLPFGSLFTDHEDAVITRFQLGF